jgi:hypothetical protein
MERGRFWRRSVHRYEKKLARVVYRDALPLPFRSPNGVAVECRVHGPAPGNVRLHCYREAIAYHPSYSYSLA